MQKQPSLKRWHIWAIGIVVTIGIIYLAWCYGLWGRENLLLQYLFQCGCPLHSEPFRYPDRVEVLIPACQKQDVSIRVSSGGALIMVESTYVLDLRSGKRIEPVSINTEILSDDLLITLDFPNNFVLDIHTHNMYPADYARDVPSIVNQWGEKEDDLNALASILRNAEEVFLTQRFSGEIVFREASKYYWILPRVESKIEFLDAHQISYIVSSRHAWDFTGELPSHSGKFIAKLDGIYLADTDERIVENYRLPNSEYFVPIAWRYDDQGIIIGARFTPWVLDFSAYLPMFLPSTFFPVSQPVLMLRIPQEYLDTPVQ